MTSDQREVLDLLTKGWKVRFRKQAWVLKELRERARHLYWLNPEPRSYWDTGDSIVGQYAAHCDGAYECRNLKQLERFVEQLG